MNYIYVKKRYIILFSILDAIGNLIFFPFRVFGKTISPNIKRLLIIRLDHIGDVISATTVLKPLRQKYPNAVIEFMAASWAADLLENNPFVDRLIRFDAPWFDRKNPGVLAAVKGFFYMVKIIRTGSYDLSIDLRGDVRHLTAMFLARIKHRIGYGIYGGGFLLTRRVPYEGLMHETDRNMALLDPIGIDGQAPVVKLYFSDRDREIASRRKEEEGVDGPYAILHAVPGNPEKRWRSENFAALAKYLNKKHGLIPVMVGSTSDREIIREIINASGIEAVDLAGKISLSQLAALSSEAALFVGVDSGPAHIAAATGIRTVILFSGTNDPRQWAPRGKNVRVIYPGMGASLPTISPEKIFRVIEEII